MLREIVESKEQDIQVIYKWSDEMPSKTRKEIKKVIDSNDKLSVMFDPRAGVTLLVKGFIKRKEAQDYVMKELSNIKDIALYNGR